MTNLFDKKTEGIVINSKASKIDAIDDQIAFKQIYRENYFEGKVEVYDDSIIFEGTGCFAGIYFSKLKVPFGYQKIKEVCNGFVDYQTFALQINASTGLYYPDEKIKNIELYGLSYDVVASPNGSTYPKNEQSVFDDKDIVYYTIFPLTFERDLEHEDSDVIFHVNFSNHANNIEIKNKTSELFYSTKNNPPRKSYNHSKPVIFNDSNYQSPRFIPYNNFEKVDLSKRNISEDQLKRKRQQLDNKNFLNNDYVFSTEFDKFSNSIHFNNVENYLENNMLILNIKPNESVFFSHQLFANLVHIDNDADLEIRNKCGLFENMFTSRKQRGLETYKFDAGSSIINRSDKPIKLGIKSLYEPVRDNFELPLYKNNTENTQFIKQNNEFYSGSINVNYQMNLFNDIEIEEYDDYYTIDVNEIRRDDHFLNNIILFLKYGDIELGSIILDMNLIMDCIINTGESPKLKQILCFSDNSTEANSEKIASENILFFFCDLDFDLNYNTLYIKNIEYRFLTETLSFDSAPIIEKACLV